jgi:hypothetical protein
MGYHPRIECKKIATFQTTRARASELWFVRNKELEQDILGYTAKYSKRYKIKLYAFAVEGNHIQFPAHFPKGNRAHFMRDLNSSVARAVPRRQSGFSGGHFWGRRYSAEYLPADEDIEEWFFYTVLQPVQDGLVDDIKNYPGYNCFEDAISGAVREYPVVDWKRYHDAKRWDPSVKIEDFITYYKLRYTKLPGYKNLSRKDYMELMREKLRVRTEVVLAERKGKPCAGPAALKKVRPGARPRKTKKTGRYDHRPRVLSKDDERRHQGKAWYFSIYSEYTKASAKYRAGDLTVKFPPGTYRPPAFTVAFETAMT